MTMIDNGVQGAKRQTMKNDPLLALCVSVYNDLPEGTDPIGPLAVRHFRDALEGHLDYPDMISTILEYYWVNAVARISRPTLTKEEKEENQRRQAQRVSEKQEEIARNVHAKLKIMFLDMILANGKTLRACTKRELIDLRPRQDRVFDGIIAALKKPSDVVGDTFKTNEELEPFWKPARIRAK